MEEDRLSRGLFTVGSFIRIEGATSVADVLIGMIEDLLLAVHTEIKIQIDPAPHFEEFALLLRVLIHLKLSKALTVAELEKCQRFLEQTLIELERVHNAEETPVSTKTACYYTGTLFQAALPWIGAQSASWPRRRV